MCARTCTRTEATNDSTSCIAILKYSHTHKLNTTPDNLGALATTLACIVDVNEHEGCGYSDYVDQE